MIGEPATKKLVLASKSPRRQKLLHQVGFTFEVRESGVDEGVFTEREPSAYVQIVSAAKASAVAAREAEAIVIGADTIVVIDGRMLGKPIDASEAYEMLTLLSNRSHEVFTGFTLHDCPTGIVRSEVERTLVRFRRLQDEEIRSYIRSGSPFDKAGAYGIQDDYGAVFVNRIEGCFYNVMGLPLAKFYSALQEFQRLRATT